MESKDNKQAVFISGGSGTVGSGIVQSFLNSGFTVYTASRQLSNLSPLQESVKHSKHDMLHCIEADISTEQGATAVLKRMQADGYQAPLHVVSCMGGWWQVRVF